MYIMFKNGTIFRAEGSIDNFPTKSKFAKLAGTDDKVPILLNTDDVSMVVNDDDVEKLAKEKK